MNQPPSGGCVLKHRSGIASQGFYHQPPSGGCVLKQRNRFQDHHDAEPAAFGRLCVETSPFARASGLILPAAFGRLCVETCDAAQTGCLSDPAAFGRLCVETNRPAF